MSEAKNVLKLENITMQFGGVVAVNDLSLEVNKGEIVALIGPNGAGKTTCFNCITGVYEPTNGIVSFEGKTIVANHPSGKMKKNYQGYNGDKFLSVKPVSPTPDTITKLGIARTFQNIRLWKSMTVFDNVLTSKHMRSRQNVFSATFRTNMEDEKKMREETLALLEEQDLQARLAGMLRGVVARRAAAQNDQIIHSGISSLWMDQPFASRRVKCSRLYLRSLRKREAGVPSRAR